MASVRLVDASRGGELQHLLECRPVGGAEAVRDQVGNEGQSLPFFEPGGRIISVLQGQILAHLFHCLPQAVPTGLQDAAAAVTEIEFARHVLAKQGAQVLVEEA